MNTFLTLLVLSFSLLISTCASAITLKTGSACTGTPSVEVSELSFQFPQKSVKHINVLNTDKASAVVTFSGNWLPILHIITTDETKISGGINQRGGFEKLGVSNIVELYKKAKTETSTNGYFSKVKQALALNTPQNIHIASINNNHIIVHKNAYEDNADAVYIIRDKDERIMMLVADMSQKEIQQLLSYTCL